MKSIFLRIFLLSFFFSVALQADPVLRKSGSKSYKTQKKIKRKLNIYTGASYIVSSKSREPFTYTRSYSKKGKYLYLSTYNIYNGNQAIRNIVAVHDKKNQTVEVTVKDLEHAGFPILNIERTQYSAPFMGRFGSIGGVGVMANTKKGVTGPGQLTLKFVSRKFDYVKVVHVAGPHEDSRKSLMVYILDEK